MSTSESPVERQRWPYKRVMLVFVLPALAAFAIFSWVVMPEMVRQGLTSTYETHKALKEVYGVTEVSWDKYGGMNVTLPNGTRAKCEPLNDAQIQARELLRCADNTTIAPSR